ncbi:hypothetical protein [Thermococcus sp.]|uniref:hypothetical protein n=1 Tax=Thermococcus sp. TaxID=35749 RepID=UPI0025F01F32|nr:hypothetical protein [Thermococcus sp.]
MTYLPYEIKKLIQQKEDELFWAQFNPEKVVKGETDRLRAEIKTLKRLYWEMV